MTEVPRTTPPEIVGNCVIVVLANASDGKKMRRRARRYLTLVSVRIKEERIAVTDGSRQSAAGGSFCGLCESIARNC